jgi:hypothetical protein
MISMEFDKTNYIMCPDPECNLFYKPDCPIPCTRECPHADDMKIVIKCFVCGKDIELPHGHFCFVRVTCECGGENFHRMSGKYRLVR